MAQFSTVAGMHRALAVLLITTFGMFACKGHAPTKTLEFSNLHSADRVEVTAPFDRKVAVLNQRQQINAAADFIQRYRDGWNDVWTGPVAPMLILQFYRGEQAVGGFGISTSYLVAGSLSRNASQQEIASLATRLGLQWPPRE
jgi:hypothetical protein